jgi:hypothetical protein
MRGQAVNSHPAQSPSVVRYDRSAGQLTIQLTPDEALFLGQFLHDFLDRRLRPLGAAVIAAVGGHAPPAVHDDKTSTAAEMRAAAG